MHDDTGELYTFSNGLKLLNDWADEVKPDLHFLSAHLKVMCHELKMGGYKDVLFLLKLHLTALKVCGVIELEVCDKIGEVCVTKLGKYVMELDKYVTELEKYRTKLEKYVTELEKYRMELEKYVLQKKQNILVLPHLQLMTPYQCSEMQQLQAIRKGIVTAMRSNGPLHTSYLI
ncbi:hypothetical protein BKA93DRAFT_750759 [Sparassis latifolia]